MSTSLGSAVFGYIFPDNREGMEQALTRLTVDHFKDKTEAKIFEIVKFYGEKYGDVFDGAFLVDILNRSKVDDSKTILIQDMYESYCKDDITDSNFQYAVDGLIEDFNQNKSGQVIVAGFDILERGREVDGTFLQGYKDANEYLLNNLGDLDRDISEESPEGDIRLDADDILSDYEKSKNQEDHKGVGFGIAALDEATSGLQPGEFAIIAAFTNHGKSQLCAQTAHHASVIEGKPTYFATTETVRNTTRRRILARHSRMPIFGHPTGLDVHAIKNGTLTKDEEALYHDVVKDYTTNSNYAPLYIAQMPRNVTVNYLENSINRVDRLGPGYEFLIVDYLQLFSSIRKRQGEREEYNEILKDAKKFAVTFGKGRGIPFLTPWQMSRDAFDSAKKSAEYSPSSLSDTSEAEKTADMIISLLRLDQHSNEALIQILKNRDGPLMSPSTVYTDYRCAYLGDTQTGATASPQDLTGGFDIHSLINV